MKSQSLLFIIGKPSLSFRKQKKKFLRDNDVRKLYIRYFDIGLHPETKEPIPISPIRFQENINNFKIVPVVFIQNKVMSNA